MDVQRKHHHVSSITVAQAVEGQTCHTTAAVVSRGPSELTLRVEPTTLFWTWLPPLHRLVLNLLSPPVFSTIVKPVGACYRILLFSMDVADGAEVVDAWIQVTVKIVLSCTSIFL